MSTPSTSLFRIDARAIADADRVIDRAADGVSVIVELVPGGRERFPARVVAVGSSKKVDAHEAAPSSALTTIQRPRALLLPGFVNAHTHLDLTHIGPRHHDPAAGFGPWIAMIRENRLESPSDVAASVAKGAALSLKGGVVAVGDIAGAVRGRASIAPAEALRSTTLIGVSFIEFFALGVREQMALGWLDEALAEARRFGLCDPQARVQVGVQPHAPYSVSPNAYLAAAKNSGLRLCTHLAESPEEHRFLTRAEGSLRDMLESIGLWSPAVGELFGRAASPVQHARGNALKCVSLVAHVNDASDEDLDTLAAAGVSVAYCPRASAYFGAERHFGPHRYREMLARGINVALGTDSIVNLPPTAAERGICILDEMRFLHQRDSTSPEMLLRMGTTNAAAALGLPSEPFTIRPGEAIAGLVAVEIPDAGMGADLIAAALSCHTQPELLFHSSDSDVTR